MLTDKKLSDIAVGKLLVDRDVLLETIYSMQYSMGPGVSLEEVNEFEKRCMSLAQESWIGLLFDLLLKPPVGCEEFEADGWDAQIWKLLQSASEKFPRTGLEVALVHFPGEGERLRTAVITTLGSTGLSESFPYVDSYFSQTGQLTEDEMAMLIDAYGDIGGERCVERINEIAKYLVVQQWEEWPMSLYIVHGLTRASAKTAGAKG